jgi:NTE family protein
MTDARRKTVGVALGGGGARGIAHLAVLKVLHENDIPIDFVAGSSVGALIGAIYCSGTPFEEVEEVMKEIRWKDLGGLSLRLKGLQTNHRMDSFLRRLMVETQFEKLKTPLWVVATDLMAAKPVVINTGDVPLAVRASTAIPGIYAPVEVDGRDLVDGALITHVPVRACREMGADVVIAVDVRAEPKLTERPNNIYSIMLQVYAIMQTQMGLGQLREANVVVRPDLHGIAWDKLERGRDIMLAGKKSAMAMLDDVRQAIDTPGWFDRFKEMISGGGR